MGFDWVTHGKKNALARWGPKPKDVESKICKKCLIEKPVSEFHRAPQARTGYFYLCKICRKEYCHVKYIQNKVRILEKSKEWQRKNRKRCAALTRKSKTGCTPELYSDLLKRQNERCDICGRHTSEFRTGLHVDHDHSSGVIRGLLCMPCNQGIGLFKESIECIQRAIEYIREHQV